MKITALTFILLISGIAGLAKDPDWVDFNLRKQLYPAEKYFTGFSMRQIEKGEDAGEVIEHLRQSAISHLANSIQVTVECVTTMNTLELDKQVYHEFRENLATFSKVELAGIETKSHVDKRRKTAYVLAFVKKSDLIDHYKKAIDDLDQKIEQEIRIADAYLESGDRAAALSTLFGCMPLFTEARQAQGMVIMLKASTNSIEQIHNKEIKVKKTISGLYQSELLTLDDVTGFLAFGINDQAGDLKGNLMVSAFTFEDAKMSSQLSRRLTNLLEKELMNYEKLQISAQQFTGLSSNEQPDYLIGGTYWDEGDRLKIIAIMRTFDNGKTLATTEAFLPKRWIRETGISWKPENFAQAYASLRQFLEEEVVDQNMSLEVWTNHGNESPVFAEDDTLQIYVRVNAPAYLRIINHLADGMRVLLVDNLYIGSDKVNRVVKIKDEFVCAEPFGAEIIQVNAQSQKFPPLLTEQKWGYTFIKNELAEIIQNTRGFKPVKNEDLKAEKRLVVTTMEK